MKRNQKEPCSLPIGRYDEEKENEEQNSTPTDNETTPETTIKILTHR